MKQPLKDRLRSFFGGNGVFWALTYLFFVILVMIFLSPLIFRFEPELATKRKRYKEDTKPRLDSSDRKIKEDCALQEHRITWSDYAGRTFNGTIKVCISDYPTSKNNRAQSSFYEQLIEFDAPKLNRLYAMFYDIAKRNQLGNTETAEMIVSCIQSIPYFLVIADEAGEYMRRCEASGQTNNFAYQYLLARRPYIDGIIQNGVQSPVEFMYNLKGDCDTRTVLLYTVLSKFKYDVVILNSDVEGHSILGINIPTGSGLYYVELGTGKKYYVWETTAEGYQIGSLPRFEPRNWYITTNQLTVR
ncbi:hypothetical protein [Runella limosa]|uniref:hypothetical protein n=1 Tax=Runella limosa TaxID=370978 RepID=UPI00041AC16A|nr:hypothetical protein [Runella limosa]